MLIDIITECLFGLMTTEEAVANMKVMMVSLNNSLLAMLEQAVKETLKKFSLTTKVMVCDIELKFHWFKIHALLLPNYKDVLE